ncbi:MAG: rhomboid family intramembrane serine protease [Waddliaceae bacterium]
MTDFHIGPSHTPTTIRRLILMTCVMSIASTLVTLIYRQLTGFIGPEYWFSLSRSGLASGYLFQPLTYLFTYYSFPYGFTFSYFFSLLFQMYVLWWLGSSLINLIGDKSFVIFYLITGILAGLTAVLFTQSGVFSGPAGSLIALAVVYVMFFPDAEIFIFMIFPIKARWLIFGGLGAYFLITLSQGPWTQAILVFSAAVYGYLYGAIAWNRNSPFPQTRAVDDRLNAFGNRISNLFRSSKTEGKIINFPNKEKILKDEEFVDKMLSKISKEGEDSLTWREKRRLKKISERKQKGN